MWKINNENWHSQALIDFTFNGKEQDYDKFRNDSFWKERFGDKNNMKSKYQWTSFYEEFATKLLHYKDNRSDLIAELLKISKDLEGVGSLVDQYKDGTKGPLTDICPFTVFSTFNRGTTDSKRIAIAKRLASFLNVKTVVPTSFDGIPTVNPQHSWFFSYENARNDDDIDTLWEMLEQAIHLVDTDFENDERFVELFNKANKIKGVGWTLTQALYWIRPWHFATLDSSSRDYVSKDLGITIKNNGVSNRCDGEDYLELCEQLKRVFEDSNSKVNSYPDLSYEAWNKGKEISPPSLLKKIKKTPQNIILYGPPGTGKTYHTVDKALEIICNKKDIPTKRKEQKKLFQEYVDKGQVVFTTFHQSLSYEDFIEGIKPEVKDNRVVYNVVDGIFKDLSNQAEENWTNSQRSEGASFNTIWAEFIKPFEDADSDEFSITIKTSNSEFKIYDINERTIRFEKANGSRIHTLCIKSLKKYYKNPELIINLGGLKTYYQALVKHLKNIQSKIEVSKEELKQYVLIIDEINRGNVASIFGELITLLETDKREGMSECITVKLPYSKDDFCIPPNLNVIGTMNTADRSVEALDVALRRRFSFIEMMPNPDRLNDIEFENLKTTIDLSKMLETMNKRIIRLKDRDHVIGHSYFYSLIDCENVKEELVVIFANKIIPLLEEYFYGDWQRIGMVLGNSFVTKDSDNIDLAPGFMDFDDVEDTYSITKSKEWKFESIYE